MDAMELLLNRESAIRLEAPGPTPAELDQVFATAVRAPDHGRLRPWRFVVIQPEQRARFGEVMAESLRRRDPEASEVALQRERDKAFRAPVIVAVAATPQRGAKIPVVEQIASASAAAQTIMLAAPALGYGAVWKTGAPAYDPAVKVALGLAPDDEIVGFLYIGTKVGGPSPLPRPEPREHVTVWAG
jgi:nitroreductase